MKYVENNSKNIKIINNTHNEVENIIEDFKKENYSDGFLKDLENGLKKSSLYDTNYTQK